MLAYFIHQRFSSKKNYELWVDYPISFQMVGQRKKTIYPDICVVDVSEKTPIIIDMIDLKMDMGWKREYYKQFNQITALILHLRGNTTALAKRLDEDLKKSEAMPVEISRNLIWRIVVISDQNINKEKLDLHRREAKNDICHNYLSFYVFSKEGHPNGGTPEIATDEINAFFTDLAR